LTGPAVAYEVVHSTRYTYESDVSASYGQIHLMPRDLPGQLCRASVVRIDPEPADYRDRVDFFGNRATYFSIRKPHTRLTVTSTSRVDVVARQVPLPPGPSWEQVRDGLAAAATDTELDARQFTIESPLVCLSAAVEHYSTPSFLPGRPLLEAVADLSSRIHADFRYRPGSTSVRTGLDEVLDGGEGVCQDFAQLAIGCLRSKGLAARYVSGYLETRPPPGQQRRQGADVSHAWASVFVPDAGWVDIDPTNDQFVNERYVVTAWGRDYTDVPPLQGVIFTEAKEHKLEVTVDVVPIDGFSAVHPG
jgi:transglutaminase-like putative cysteine protease